MTQSEMRAVVNQLLEDKSITIKALSEESRVSENVIKKLRAGYRTVDKTLFESIEKLYIYAKKREGEQ